MRDHSVTRRLFATTLARWAHAVEIGDMDSARFQLEQLKSVGQMMVIHPDFQRALSQQKAPESIETVTEALRAFLSAATEMHAEPVHRV